jgi:hypothetical protein
LPFHIIRLTDGDAMKIDVMKWDAARLAVEGEIRALKKLIRKTPRPQRYWDDECGKPGERLACFGDYLEYKKLALLKAVATRLYSIRAAARGKAHAHLTEEPGEFALPAEVAA